MLDILAFIVSILFLLFLWFFFFFISFLLVVFLVGSFGYSFRYCSLFNLFSFFILLYEKLREEVFRQNGFCDWFLKPGGAILFANGEDRCLSMSKPFQCSSQTWAPIRAAGFASIITVRYILCSLYIIPNKGQTGYKV